MCPIEATRTLIEDGNSKEWSSEEEIKSMNRNESISKCSKDDELIAVDENCNGSTESNSDVPEQLENKLRTRRQSVVIPNKRILSCENPRIKESLQSNCDSKVASPRKLNTPYQSPTRNIHHSSVSNSPSKRNSRCSSRNLVSI